MNPKNYFPPKASLELSQAGVPANAAWLIQYDFILGRGYVRQEPKIIALEDVPPSHEIYKNQQYYPAIELP